MTKAGLAEQLAQRVSMSRRDAARALDGALAIIQEELARGGEVSLAGFGKFHRGVRGARAGVNPRTGEAMTIPVTQVPRFTAGSALKKAVRAQ